ncbi:transketolase family protein [Campylobacter upsaliensis]|uniref:transketolase family protein n=1 Tax=Campylobacter upsaliensis TaxID=28080 RepID=UPI00214A65B5|nr:transketolase [Campylobacter upsaliensis]MCR2115718.1 transketolase [Campylobacter upsaliensis]MCR2121220.1 transketolase [Campylobacter upsaliensis]
MRNSLANSIIQKAKVDPNLFLIVGDAGLGLFDTFQVDFKEQYLNAGINEACSVGMAAGLALSGKKVIYYNIAPFSLMRPYEQVRNDICYQELPVIVVGIGSGLTYAPAGVTHYAVEDIAIALTIPNLQIFSPCDANETVACFEYAYSSNKPSYIRIPKNGDPIYNKSVDDITKLQEIKMGESKIAFVTHSNLITEVMNAADHFDASVYTVPFINSKFNYDDVLGKYQYVFVVEEAFEYGSLGSYIREHSKINVNKIGIKNHFIHKIGNQQFLRRLLKIDSCGIIERVKDSM